MSDFIKLKAESLFNLNLDHLNNDFTFVVNGEAFYTNKFVASLLSPAVSNLLSTDPSIDLFEINTEFSHGNFQILLNLVSCRKQVIEAEDRDFLCEITNILQNKYLQIELNLSPSDITYENVFTNLLTELQHSSYYRSIIDKKISILAENLYQILSNEEERQILSQINLEVIEQILSQKNLVIDGEDQLLEFVDFLYTQNHEFSILYQYVNFAYCSSTSMKTFIENFSIEDISQSIWTQITGRLEQSTPHPITPDEAKRLHHYIICPKGSEDFDGIVKHLQRQTNGEIQNEIEITASSILDDDETKYNQYYSIQYDNRQYFETKDQPNSWICFEFKNHQIIPTHYTIRSRNDGRNSPKHFKIEISKDKMNWEEVDSQSDSPFTNDNPVTFTFTIDVNKQKEAKFIRLTQTGLNSWKQNYLVIDSIEFYGYLK